MVPWMASQKEHVAQQFAHNTVLDQARAHFGNTYEGPVSQHFYSTNTSRPPEHAEGTEPGLVIVESLRFDQIDDRHATIGSALAKTCSWLLETQEYKDWRDPYHIDRHHGFMWIKGKPGAGKSTMMKYAFDHDHKAQGGDVVISFFFNARGVLLERSVEGMYRSLILQLLEKLPQLQSGLSVWLPHFSKSGAWSVDILKNLFSILIHNLHGTRVRCYVDALDECDERQLRDHVIYFLRDLTEITVTRGTKLYVLFSSRHYPHISLPKSLEIVLEDQTEHENDITHYIQSRLSIGKSKKSKELMEEVRAKAEGVFLWVVLVVPMLNEEYDRGKVHALRRRLLELPARLSDLFKEILARSPPVGSEVLLTLQWVLFSRRPLRSEELYYGILSGTAPDAISSWDPSEVPREDMIRFIVDCSRGLAKATKGKAPVIQFIHETVKEYLLRPCNIADMYGATEDEFRGLSHDRIKENCQRYLSSKPVSSATMCRTLPKANSEEAKQLRSKLSSEFPLLQYATDAILYHADAAQQYGVPQLDFLKQHSSNLGPMISTSELIICHDLFQKHEIRRYGIGADLKYILADSDLINLLKVVILSKPSNTPSRGGRYGSPLGAAIANGNLSCVELLLDHDQEAKMTPVEWRIAERVQSKHLLRRLLANGMVALDRATEAALAHTALETRDLETLVSFVENGIDIMVRDSNHVTLVRKAFKSAEIDDDVAKMLIKLAVKRTDCADEVGSILADAIREYNTVGIEVALTTIPLWSEVPLPRLLNKPLNAACRQGRSDLVRKFLEMGAQVSISAVIRLVKFEGVEGLRALLDSGVDIKALLGGELESFPDEIDKNQFHGNALFHLCRQPLTEAVKVFLDLGLDVNAPCDASARVTPLYQATLFAQYEMAKLLIDYGADVDSRGPVGSALEVAQWCLGNGHDKETLANYWRIIRLLREKGAKEHSPG